MKLEIIEQSAEWIPNYEGVEALPNADKIYRLLKQRAKVCTGKELSSNSGDFVRNQLMKNGRIHHAKPFRFISLTARLITSIAISREFMTHHVGIEKIEKSTRFTDDIKFVKPRWVVHTALDLTARCDEELSGINVYGLSSNAKIFLSGCFHNINYYSRLMQNGLRKQDARDILPLYTATEIIATANLQEWDFIFRERVLGEHGSPHPDITALLEPLYWEVQNNYPIIFGGE